LLQSAIKTGRIPQSFLFSGPRGIGKTSTARILAKALNCLKGPRETPCNECTACLEVTRANSLDVLEVDGASNRGIDEIRTLRENVKFKPAQARFKIYIIDEVHMLTGEAFNALLKTLEEPPDHVKFIFATTEPHKVPLTILSRCQRFNFKRISTETIAGKLAEIAKAEGLKPDEKALYLIARVADGSLRDAETLLDQLSVLSKGEIKEKDILFALGLAGAEVYFNLLESLRQKNAAKIFGLIKELYESGKDLVQFGRGLYELFRNLLLLQIGKGAEEFMEMGAEDKKELARFKDIFSREELLLALSLLQNLQGDLRRSLAAPKLLLETALLNLLHLEGLQSVKELAENVSSLRGLAAERPGRSPDASGVRASPTKDAGLATPSIMFPSKDGGSPRGAMKERTQEAPHAVPSVSFALPDVERVWPQVIEAVKSKEMSSGMFLAESAPIEAAGDQITLGFPEELQFHKEMLDRPEKKKLIEEHLSRFLGAPARIQLVTTRIQTQTPSGAKAEPAVDPSGSKVPDIVRQAMDIFSNSKIIRVD
jgi:DNA polymerase-3 subunit gamma/tau